MSWRSLKFWGVMLVILGFIGLLAFGLTSDPKKVPSPLLGKMAPDFSVTSLDGKSSLKLSELKGIPVVLNFWGSWCPECTREAPVLEAFYQRYDKGQNKVRVLGIAFQDTPSRAKAFAKRFGKNYFLALDDDEGSIALNYGLYGAPETFFIDPKGIIRFKQVGGVTPDLLLEQLESML
ncbi:MAG: redoxin domain-containing protein [SAR324 cluster bacterium]|nr:redoxin domain-containing protein [SAR324 cluster bacterium]